MFERKQSFLERLTGVQTLQDGGRKHATRGRVTDDEDEGPVMYTPGSVYEEDPRAEASVSSDDDGDEGEEVAGLAVDMYETENELIIQSMIAGVTPENLHISVTRDNVTIRGRRIAPEGIPGDQYHVNELYWGEFSRDLQLPFEIDTDGAEAVEKYGLLIIRLPRLDTNRSAELKVKSI